MWNTPNSESDLTEKDKTRFWDKVDKLLDSDCWEWMASCVKGYGQFMVRGKRYIAPRLSYFFAKGKIPEGMFICHRCDNPGCVNPAHLFAGTHLDNERDKCSKNRQPKGENHWAKRNPHLIARGNRHNSVTKPESVLRGEAVGGSKLTLEKVVSIRNLSANGARHIDLADKFGVTESNIRLIITRQRWKHVK